VSFILRQGKNCQPKDKEQERKHQHEVSFHATPPISGDGPVVMAAAAVEVQTQIVGREDANGVKTGCTTGQLVSTTHR
jgi:hypothetical protein